MKLYLLAVFVYLIIGIYQAWRRNDDIEEFTPAALLIVLSAIFFAFIGVNIHRCIR